MRGTWLGAALIVTACASVPAAQPRPAGETLVRVRNGTDREMTQLRMGFPDRLSAERLGPGESTPYQPVRRVVGFLYFEAVIDGERLVIQPADFMGPRYGPGRYTFLISFRDAAAGRSRDLGSRMTVDR